MIRSTRHRISHFFTSRFPSAGWPWLVPLAVALFLYLSPLGWVQRGIAVLIGVAFVLIASRRPDRALLALIVLLPFHTLLLAELFHLGAPLSIVRPLEAWKEALVLGLVVTGIRDFHASSQRLDRLDWLAIAFIAVTAVYAVAGPSFLPEAPAATDVRLFGFRQSAVFVILLLAARHTRFPAGFTRQAARVVLGTAVAVAVIGIYGFVVPASWNSFLIDVLAFPRYQASVLHTPLQGAVDYIIYGQIGGLTISRLGSVFLNSLSCGFYLVIGFAVAIERVIRQGPRPLIMAALLLIGGALVLTGTRSAILGAAIATFLAFRPAAGRQRQQRLRLAVVVGTMLILLAPAAVLGGVAARTTGAATGVDLSAPYHAEAFSKGIGVLVSRPLGQGLGTSAGTGQRFGAENVIISENAYVQVGNELGIPAMLLFIALTIVTIRELRRATRVHDDVLLAAIYGAAFGLAVGAVFLHTWNEFAVAWTLWALAGASLSVARHGTAVEPAREPESTTQPVAPAAKPSRTGYRVPAGAR